MHTVRCAWSVVATLCYGTCGVWLLYYILMLLELYAHCKILLLNLL